MSIKLRHITLSITLILILSSCATPREAQQRQLQYDQDTCTSFGYTIKTKEFSDCLLKLHTARQKAQASRPRHYYHHRYPRHCMSHPTGNGRTVTHCY